MIFKTTIKSEIDNTQKFIYTNDNNQIVEIAYIDKDDGKHIMCVPTQTNCAMGCKFCHTREVAGKIAVSNLKSTDIVFGVKDAYERLNLSGKPLLVSYMGCGEPLGNIAELGISMEEIRKDFAHLPLVRFAIATLMPKNSFGRFVALANVIKSRGLNVKIHLSLHFTEDELRNEWMPMAENIKPSVDMLEWYKDYTGNSVEIHYTPIQDINNSFNDILNLCTLLGHRDIPIKFLKFSTRKSEPYQPADNVEYMMGELDSQGIECEFYDPPGRDVGASCGQFLFDYYKKYSKVANG